MLCPNCRSARLVEITMTLRDQRVTMHSCPACEQRWWDQEGRKVGLRSVLELASP